MTTCTANARGVLVRVATVLFMLLASNPSALISAHSGGHGAPEAAAAAALNAPPPPHKSAPTNADDLWDSQVLQNTEHIQEELEEFFNMKKEDLTNLTSQELEYYYFELHDFDKNRKLDGLELLKAIVHMVQHGEKNVEAVSARTEDFSVAIDQVLQSDDLDQDGYLSYAEFITTMKKSEARTAKKNDT